MEIDGPFEIRPARAFVLKADHRLPVTCGERIEVVKAEAIVNGIGQDLSVLVDGTSLSQWDNDFLWECDTQAEGMWISTETDKIDVIEFDLGVTQTLSCAQVWNYNVSDATQQGLGHADVAVWTEAHGWTTVLKEVAFVQAEGTSDYDEPTVLPLEGITASKVRFTHLTGLESDDVMGLSEVRFFTQRSPKASKPHPATDSQVAWKTQQPMAWTPGLNAVTQKVYMGLAPDDMVLLETVEYDGVCAGTLQGCSPDTPYYWRVDSVQSDGSVITGTIWTFRANLTAAHWPFDETEGRTARDQSKYALHAEVKGQVDWRPDEGKVGGALMLDGTPASYVDLPDAVGSGPGGKTLALWVYPTASRRWARFIEFGNGENQDNVLFSRFVFTDDLVLSTYRESAGGGRVYARGAIDPNTWQFLAVTLDDEGNAKIYKNGELVAEGNSGAVVRDVVRTENFIGRSNWSVDDNYQGLIDDVWIINTVLSDQEIQGLYQGQGYRPTTTPASLPKLVMAPMVTSSMPAEVTPLETPKSGAWLRIVVLLVVVAGLILLGRKTQGRNSKP